jgi:large subunit ribosomal protein L46
MATEASSSSFKACSSASKNAQILTSTILNRSPILTRTLDPFEEAYHTYQRRLYRALSQTLPANVYFKPGSLLQRRVAIEELAREKEAFGEDWEPLRGLRVEEDDVAGGENEGAGGMGTKSFAQQMAEEAELEEKPQSRVHRADVEGDVKSLDRLGERNLYLIVKQDLVWTFPTGSAETEQVPLHEARCTIQSKESGSSHVHFNPPDRAPTTARQLWRRHGRMDGWSATHWPVYERGCDSIEGVRP